MSHLYVSTGIWIGDKVQRDKLPNDLMGDESKVKFKILSGIGISRTR